MTTPNEQLKASLQNYVNYYLQRPDPTAHHHLVVACLPKSGSTWLCAVLEALPGFRSAILVPGWGRREQELSELRLILNHQRTYVSQLHLRWSEPTRKLMEYFAVRPIVLVRNVFDVIPSLRDHFRYEGVDGSFAYVSPEVPSWPDARVEDFIVDLIVPWYLNFYMSWRDCPDKLVLGYDTLLADMPGAVRLICDTYGIAATDAEITEAVARAAARNTRRNAARAGRGAALSPEARARVMRLASYYPDVDFTPIGIP